MNFFRTALVSCGLFSLLMAGCAPAPAPATPTPTPAAPAALFFDDFAYTTQAEMTANGWVIRSGQGWPGVEGSTFRPENVSFEAAETPGDRILRMSSSTAGSGENTFQTQICHQRKYLEGTYAARVRFYNEPVFGKDGDQVVETFYMITPYEKPHQPTYSEMDFEYLANGGWGSGAQTFHFTTWETVQIEPWDADNASQTVSLDMAGWHTLVLQAVKGQVRYFVDGKITVQHSGNYFPDAPMSINFNLWFIQNGLVSSTDQRQYQEDIDWVFHLPGVSLSPDQVLARVAELRDAATPFLDTVPDWTPKQDSPCDL